ncbi:YciI family protein [Aeromicrobium sp. NPDC092404]|uniref:YciI family protein n=1 Tax=Aeromicrobium sp. NPDC092404 TaxID=3154976 RepID=UPI00341683A9
MTQYMLSVHATPETYDMPLEEAQPMYDATEEFNQKLMAEGSWVFGGGLERIESATTVDGRGSDVIVTDGPYLETKEFLGGFWVIEAPDLDAALKIAAEGSKACGHSVEVRPFQVEPE